MKTDPNGIRTTWIGLIVNLLLGFTKIGAGAWMGSKALMADGLHSFVDLLTDFAVLFGMAMARRPEDENHHFGHHKFVSFAKFFVGSALLVFAGLLVFSAILDFRAGRAVLLSGGAAAVALAGLVVKEALFQWTRRVARRIHSDLLLANAWHHRMDSLSSLGVAVALVGVWLGGPEWAFLDGAVTLVLGVYLFVEAFKIGKGGVDDLVDAAPAREIVEDFREHVLPTPGAMAYHDFRVRRVGDVYEVDLHLQVDPALTVERGHQIAREVKRRLQDRHPEVSTVLVHLEPATDPHLKTRGLSGWGSEI